MPTATVGILKVILTGNSAEFETAMKRASGTATAFSKDLGNIGRQATAIGGAMTKTLTLPLVALGAGSVKAAMDFESSFANVAKTVDGVSDKFGVLTPKGAELAMTFRNMAKEIPATTDELNKIAALGGQMGVPIENLGKFTQNVAALGVAVDGIGAEEAAMGLAQIANVFGDKQVTNIDKMSSALVHLGNSSNATEADILEFTKRLSGAGAAAGMTVPEVMAIGTAMANVGINAEAGGTAMSTMIQKMSMAVSEGGSKLKAFDEIVAHTGKSFSEMWKESPTQAVNAVVVGLGKAKAAGEDLNLVVRDIGATNIRTADTMKRLAGAGDSIATSLKTANEGWDTGNKHLEEAQKKYATTANQMKILWNHITDIGITLGNALLPAIKSMIGLMTTLLPIVEGMANAFAALPGPAQAVIVGLGLIFAAAGPVIWVFGQMISSAGTIVGAFGKTGIATRALALAFGTTGTAATGAAGGITAVGTASTVATPGVTALSAAFGTALFWTGIGVAIAGIAFGIYKVVGAIKEASKALSEGRFWEFFTSRDKDNWLRSALGLSTSNASPSRPLASMPASAELAAFNTAVIQSRELAAANKNATQAKTDLTKATVGLSQGLQTASSRSREYTGEIDKAAIAAAKLQRLFDGLSPGLQEGISSMPGVNVGLPNIDAVMIPDIIFDTHTKLQEGISKMPGLEFPIAPPKMDIPLFGREFGQQLGGVLVNAFRGGGVMRAVADGASLVGSTLMTGLATKLTTGANAITGWLGGMISSALPLIGSLVGPLIDKIAGLFGNKGRDLVKDFAASFGGFDALHAQLGALGAEGEQLWIKLTQGVGRNNPQQAQAAIDAITSALGKAEEKAAAFNTALGGLLGKVQSLGMGLPDSLKQYLLDLQKAGKLTQENIDLLAELSGQGETDWRKIQEAVERYGGDISKLGGTFQAQRLHDSWMQVIDDMALFESGGMDAAAMLDLTQGKINDLVQESMRFGTEIPENMRPWIEKLIESGELVDDSGEKITDIGKLKFGETLQTSLEKLTDEIKNLIKALGGVPSAAETAAKGAEKAFNDAKPTLKVGVVYEDDGRPRLDYPERGMNPSLAATGGMVTPWGVQYRALGGPIRWTHRGTDTVPAMLTPGEVILNEGQQGRIGDALRASMQAADAVFASAAGMSDGSSEGAGSIKSETHLYVDRREFARAMVDVYPNQVRRLGVRVRA